MTTLRQLVHGRVDRAERRLLEREAEIRGISVTKCVGDIIRERIAAMIDWLVQLYLAHTPEVPEERRPAAAAAVQRRYANYRKAVSDSVGANSDGGAVCGELTRSAKGG